MPPVRRTARRHKCTNAGRVQQCNAILCVTLRAATTRVEVERKAPEQIAGGHIHGEGSDEGARPVALNGLVRVAGVDAQAIMSSGGGQGELDAERVV
jgi:hypothetical protein